MAETVYLFTVTILNEDDGSQYVKTWRVTEAMDAWCEEYLGDPHAEFLAPEQSTEGLYEQLIDNGVVAVVNE